MDLELIRNCANNLIKNYKQNNSLRSLKDIGILGSYRILKSLKYNFNNPLAGFAFLSKGHLQFCNKLLIVWIHTIYKIKSKYGVVFRTLSVWRFLYEFPYFKGHKIVLILKNKSYDWGTLASMVINTIYKQLPNNQKTVNILFSRELTVPHSEFKYLSVFYTTDYLSHYWKPLNIKL